MKKIVLCFLFIFLFSFVACDLNDTVPNENKIKLDITENFKEYIKLDEIPSFVFEFEGNLNTIKNVTKPYYTVFRDNEDIILSDAIAKIFEEYKDSIYFEVVNEDKVSNRKFTTIENGKVKNINMPCDNETVYDEVAYIPLSNGLKLTMDYCRFESEGKTYYTWRYSRSIAFYLYYPLMRVDNKGSNELVILTLPNRINLHVGPDLRLSNILTKDEYLSDTYYTFDYLDGDDLEVKKNYVLDYYKDYNLVKIDDNNYSFEYLNNKFKLTLTDANFKIYFLERL